MHPIEINPVVNELLGASNPEAWLRQRMLALSTLSALQGKDLHDGYQEESKRSLETLLEDQDFDVVGYFSAFHPAQKDWKQFGDYLDNLRYRAADQPRRKTLFTQYCELISEHPESYVPQFILDQEIFERLDEDVISRLKIENFKVDAHDLIGWYTRHPKTRKWLRKPEADITKARASAAIAFHEEGVFHPGMLDNVSLFGLDDALRYVGAAEYQPCEKDWPVLAHMAENGHISKTRLEELAAGFQDWRHVDDRTLAKLATCETIARAILPTRLHILAERHLVPKDFDPAQLVSVPDNREAEHAIFKLIQRLPKFPEHLERLARHERSLPEGFLYYTELSASFIHSHNMYPSMPFLQWAVNNHSKLFELYAKNARLGQEEVEYLLEHGASFDITQGVGIKPKTLDKWLAGQPAETRDACVLQLHLKGLKVSIPAHLLPHVKALNSVKI